MGKDNTPAWGAKIERGIITEKAGNGYTVQSYDRPGIIGAWLPALDGKTHAEGEKVYFFLLRDGTGMILTGIEEGG